MCVCLCVCLSAATYLHYCKDPDVTWESGKGCPLVVHYWADLQSVHGLRCYGNTRNAWQSHAPPPSLNRHHRSNGDWLEDKRENYQVCSVQYCVQQLCIYEQTTRRLDWVLSHWAHFTVLRFIFVFCVSLYIACMCRIITW